MEMTNNASGTTAQASAKPHEPDTREYSDRSGGQPAASTTGATGGPFDWKYIQFTEEEQQHLDSLSLEPFGQKYRRIGYYASLQQPHLGEAGFEDLRVREEQPFDERLAENDLLLAQRQQLLTNQLSVLDEQLANERRNVEQFFGAEQPKLQAELQQLEQDIAQVDEQWTALRQQLARKKEELSKGRFDKLKAELTQVAEFAESYRAKAKKSLEEHNPDSTKVYHNWLRKWRAQLEENQAKVAARLHRLADAGFSLDERASYRYFYALFGLLATVIAGWFFSIYTSTDDFSAVPLKAADGSPVKPPTETVFSGQSLVSVLVRAFLEYTGRVGGVRFVSYGLAAITVITVFVVLYDELNIWLIKRRNKKLGISDESTRRALQKNQVKIESDFEQPDAFFKFNLRAGNWLEFWFKLAPALIIILPVLAVIGFLIRNPPASLNGKDIYEAYFYPFYNSLYGSWLALALAGIFYIYLLRKLEKPDDGTPASQWPGIGLLLVAFPVFLLLLAVDYVVPAIRIHQVALVGFGYMSIVAGVCIGYYLRVSSLLHSQWLYQEEIIVITRSLSHYESMGRVELLRAEVDAVLGALETYGRNTATITDLSYAFEIPRYYQAVEARVLREKTTGTAPAATAPQPENSWKNLWGFWQRISSPFQRKKGAPQDEATTQTERTWTYTTVRPPVQLKVRDQTLFPVLAEDIALKYEEYCLKQARREQVLGELLGPHTTARTILGRLYAEMEALERKKEPLIAEQERVYNSYKKQGRIIRLEKQEALLHLAEGYFAHQWELTASLTL